MTRARLILVAALATTITAIVLDWPGWSRVLAGTAAVAAFLWDRLSGIAGTDPDDEASAHPLSLGTIAIPSGSLALVDNAMLSTPRHIDVEAGTYKVAAWLSGVGTELEVSEFVVLSKEAIDDLEAFDPLRCVLEASGPYFYSDSGHWLACDRSLLESPAQAEVLGHWMRAACFAPATRPTALRHSELQAIMFHVSYRGVEVGSDDETSDTLILRTL